jgi:two-component system phosphate regulon response regulator OmpR
VPRELTIESWRSGYARASQPAPPHGTMSDRILMIEDDARLSDMVSEYLGKAGFRVYVCGTAAEGLARLAHGAFDALVLDLMLPDMDGLEVCRAVRARPGAEADLPILMLTARGDATDRVVGLELGADDYLPKPFDPRELLARLRAVLRRRVPGRATDVLRFGRLEIDRGARTVRLDGDERPLTSYQFALLVALAERPGRVMSRDELMDLVRGEQLEAFDRSIDVHVSRIRAAIEDDPKHPRRIVTVRGAGYVFARSQDEHA